MSFAVLRFRITLVCEPRILTGVHFGDISTLGLLESAHRLGGERLKRFVLLGSSVSVMNSFARDDEKGRDYTEDDWNPVRGFYL